MPWIISLVFALSFFITFFSVIHWIHLARRGSILSRDVHKPGAVLVPDMGGICVVLGFLIGILFYVAILTFHFKTQTEVIKIIAASFTIVLAAVIGIVDDILGWKIGLGQRQKPFLTILAAIPMMVILNNYSEISIPFFGIVDSGILYPLLIVPIGIVGAANGFNMVGTYNGLEAGLGAVILSFLGFIAYRTGSGWVAVMAFAMVSAILAFLWFNKYPARIFPGNTFSFSVGAAIACVAILGNMEKVALFMFIPFFVQLFLKARGRMRKESFSNVSDDASLVRKYQKFYAIEHIAAALVRKIKGKVYEWEVVVVLVGIQLILGMASLFIV